MISLILLRKSFQQSFERDINLYFSQSKNCRNGFKSFSLFKNNFKRCLITPNVNQTQISRKLTTSHKSSHRSTVYYIIATGILTLGLSYAAVPLYRIFCQAYSYGGEVKRVENAQKVESLQVRNDHEIVIKFNADTAAAMTWNFKPQQTSIKVLPGETALAFYSARNPTNKQVIGISTYNVIPFEAGQYFNKIQCFCFEEQLLNPGEEVSLPVFFYIDPEFADDPSMENVDELFLSYTFFEAKEGLNLPLPGFMQR